MAFLDDVSRKLTMFSQEAASQTKAFAEIARINSKISDEEKQINAYFLQLGKKYFEDNKSNPNVEHADLINNIKDAMQRIDLYKEDIRIAKGVKACPQCGSDVPSASLFCSYCGAKVPPSELLGRVKCPQCGGEVSENTTICTHCGYSLGHVFPGGTEGLGTAMNQSGAYFTPGAENTPLSVNTSINNNSFSQSVGGASAIPTPIFNDMPAGRKSVSLEKSEDDN